jgi:transcription elongation factor Elf1
MNKEKKTITEIVSKGTVTCRVCGSTNTVEKVESKHTIKYYKDDYRVTLFDYKYIECNVCKNTVCDEYTEKRINSIGEKMRQIINISK